MNIKEESLKRALNANRLPELPKQFREDSGEYWLEAVILTRKRDGSQSYVLGRRDAGGKICYKADYGSMSPIAGLISVHPYLYLDKQKYMPYETINQKRDALVRFIGGDSEASSAVREMSDEDVENSLLSIAIEAQYNSKDIAATHDRIIAAVKGEPSVHGEMSGALKTENAGTLNNDRVGKASECEIEEGRPKRISKRRMQTETHTGK